MPQVISPSLSPKDHIEYYLIYSILLTKNMGTPSSKAKTTSTISGTKTKYNYSISVLSSEDITIK
jgi:hypothetical protein